MFPTTLLNTNTMLFIRLANSLFVDKYNIDAHYMLVIYVFVKFLNIKHLALKYVAILTKMQQYFNVAGAGIILELTVIYSSSG